MYNTSALRKLATQISAFIEKEYNEFPKSDAFNFLDFDSLESAAHTLTATADHLDSENPNNKNYNQ